MRACIQQGVDVIGLPPVVEDGWDAVLTEAKNAKIPVIIVDRSVSADPSLYASHIGSDMALEGQRAAAEINKVLPNGGGVLELSGTTGSGAAVGRAKGFREKINANVKILDTQTGNFTRAEAKPVMEAFLKKYKPGTDFQALFIHNDDMGIGAIEALKAAVSNQATSRSCPWMARAAGSRRWSMAGSRLTSNAIRCSVRRSTRWP